MACYFIFFSRSSFSFFILAAAPDHPYFVPGEMLQVFSLGLSSPLAHPINIYGSFSVRDGWEPLRNYLFRRSRDDPAMISQVSDACSCPELKLCKKKKIELCKENGFIQSEIADLFRPKLRLRKISH